MESMLKTVIYRRVSSRRHEYTFTAARGPTPVRSEPPPNCKYYLKCDYTLNYANTMKWINRAALTARGEDAPESGAEFGVGVFA
jgi:hypothetical protein